MRFYCIHLRMFDVSEPEGIQLLTSSVKKLEGDKEKGEMRQSQRNCDHISFIPIISFCDLFKKVTLFGYHLYWIGTAFSFGDMVACSYK